MTKFNIAEKSDSEGRVYFKALGFLDGKSYRGIPTRKTPRSDVLKIMTRNQHARHPAEWPERSLGRFEIRLRKFGEEPSWDLD